MVNLSKSINKIMNELSFSFFRLTQGICEVKCFFVKNLVILMQFN
jgi:hypothetical protein